MQHVDPELRKNTSEAIGQIERTLRNMIEGVLRSSIPDDISRQQWNPDDWWRKHVPTDVRTRCDRIKVQQEKSSQNQEKHPWKYATLWDLYRMIEYRSRTFLKELYSDIKSPKVYSTLSALHKLIHFRDRFAHPTDHITIEEAKGTVQLLHEISSLVPNKYYDANDLDKSIIELYESICQYEEVNADFYSRENQGPSNLSIKSLPSIPTINAEDNQSTEVARQVNTELVAEVAGLLGISASDLFAAFETAERLSMGKAAEVGAESKTKNSARIFHEGMVTKVLTHYYPAPDLGLNNLAPYTFIVDGVSIDTSMVYRADWVGLSLPLGGDQERCQLIRAPSPKAQIPIERVAHLLATMARRGNKIWSQPLYRLIDVEISTSNLTASFALDEYLRYRFTVGLLFDELVEALHVADLNVDNVLARRTDLLSVRQTLLPESARLVDFSSYVCGGGIQVLLAMARARHDFIVPLQRRSKDVADKQGLLSLIPRAVHQPEVDPDEEISLSSTVFRELYEELFGGKEAERNVSHIKADWYVDKCEAIRWLRDHKDSYTLECTNFGIAPASGNYEFGIVLAIHDEYFWKQYGDAMERNWESSRRLADKIQVSSSDARRLSALIQGREWDDGSLCTFVEGLHRLKQLAPSRVSLPDMERLTPIKPK